MPNWDFRKNTPKYSRVEARFIVSNTAIWALNLSNLQRLRGLDAINRASTKGLLGFFWNTKQAHLKKHKSRNLLSKFRLFHF